MKYHYSVIPKSSRHLGLIAFTGIMVLFGGPSIAQTCPTTKATVSSFPNTYYPGTSASLSAGSSSLILGPASHGATPIASGDILLIIQMQGAQIAANNNSSYGTGTGTSGSGYLANGNLMAGNMEYVVANGAVPLTGGTLTLKSGLVHSYQNHAYDTTTNGQYSYQILRVPIYYDVVLGGGLTVPAWNGTSGGVLVLYAVDSINMNGQKIFAYGAGFRGGAAPLQTGGAGTLNTDYITTTANTTNGPKGEGIAGTPRWVAGTDNLVEGYPGGSWARGAPGTAGGGGTDGNPTVNDQNTGGGGGGNGGPGGNGGNGWSSGSTTGGSGGSIYAQASPSAMVLGGGGGSGTTNNGTGNPAGGTASGGSPGGGIVIVIAGTAFSGTGIIEVSGSGGATSVVNDGSGGGGAGGTALIYSGTGGGLSNITVNANGGTGGANSGGGAKHGPGGGGGGGVIWANGTLNAASAANPGAAGFTSGNSSYGSSSGSIGSVKLNISSAQLSPFPVSCSLLGVSFVSTTAQAQNGQVQLDWSIANEINTLAYQVEKSVDGRSFAAISSVDYKTASSNINQYLFIDRNGISGTGVLYYRVKEIEWSGTYIYSKVVSVSVEAGTASLAVYPNPISQSATVSFASATQGSTMLRLVDMKGTTVWQMQYEANAGLNSLSLPASGLSDGLYFLQWSDGHRPQTVKLLVKR
jgi:hypothetical protein